MKRGCHLASPIDLNPLDLDRKQLVGNCLGECEVVLDGGCELLVVTSRVGVWGVGNLGSEAETSRLREIIWGAESVGPKLGIDLVFSV